ncbi:MAG: glycoside hydrolase family 15 protein [Actinomycetota bacterium]|nr:glycoside hydrolase family 15 protein [Actinomycetota bacterium]
MAARIEDYALLSDMESAALVGVDGSIDWLTFPRFDSAACFTALLGEPRHGRWLLAPAAGARRVTRRYLGDSLVLETVFECDGGEVAVIDCMPPRDEQLNVVRLVDGRRGRVAMRTELIVRFGYGSVVPWVRTIEGRWVAMAGPDALRLVTPVELHGEGEGNERCSVAEFSVAAGERVPFVLTWFASHTWCHEPVDATASIDAAQRWWQGWSDATTYEGGWAPEVRRSLTVLKGLTHAGTGGVCAAPTTSLPEALGGVRNWDYRYCWLRDATFTLMALMDAGHTTEAVAWRDWLLRAVAGDPADLQIMYGLAGERQLAERELPWLPGYGGSAPVRVGNAAAGQFQLDVYGEVVDALHQGSLAGLEFDDNAWQLQRVLLEFLEGAWQEPDEGIWEVRGPRRDFTHSKVMAWVAADRIVATAERFDLDGPIDRWRALRDDIHSDVLDRGVDNRGVFVQTYGSSDLDASLLLVPIVGFLPASDTRVVATVDAIERELLVDGFVLRYHSGERVDGLPGGEGAFLLCTFWLADALALMGRNDEAQSIFERLLGLRNDVGLLSEEYDPATKRLLGNFPQAFSHTAIINTAATLSRRSGPMQRRAAPHRKETSHDRAVPLTRLT